MICEREQRQTQRTCTSWNMGSKIHLRRSKALFAGKRPAISIPRASTARCMSIGQKGRLGKNCHTADESTTLAVEVACTVSPSNAMSRQSPYQRPNRYVPPSPNLVPALNNPRYPSNTRAPCAELVSDQPMTTICGIRSRNTSRKRIASRRISGKICV